MMKATQDQAVAVTSVFWDIKTRPVPPDCDAGVVGRCIKRFLEKLGYSGPLTIIAVGLLTDVPDDFLLAVSSTGIVINHAPLGSIGILRTMYAWKESYPPPANMILISSNPSILPQIRHSSGYNIFHLFPYESLWKDFLLPGTLEEEDKCSGTAESAYWLCSVCSDHVCQGFENFPTHLSSQEHEHKATQMDEEAVAATSVFWDINSSPVPPECDARRVLPCIKQYLEEDLGYSGPLTINAIGQLTDVPLDVLRAVSSTGIILKHLHLDSADIIDQWTCLNPPPANVVVICTYSEACAKLVDILVDDLHDWGYNIIELFPYNSSYSESLWKKFLLEDSGTLDEEDKCSETSEHASWVCSVSHDISGKGFENFITHLSQEHEQNMDEEAVAATFVLWDIKSCPVPPDCDARRVRPCIEQYLEDLGYSGPHTINATGLLTDAPLDVLQAVSSTGIGLHHIAFDSGDIMRVMYEWIQLNPRPANMMVICPYSESLAKAVGDLQDWGCNIIELFPFNSPYSESLWKKFLLEDSGALVLEDKCSETGEHASWVCSVFHYISGKGFENFITHLSSQEHEHKPTEMVAAVTVFWDIKGFPLPPGCDARQVCLRIKWFLEDFGYSGPFTINAIGLLTEVPLDVLRAVSSTGIVLKHVPFDSREIMNQWISFNPPPANMLVICPYSETLAKVVASLQEQGYTIMVPFLYSDWEYLCLADSGTLEEEEDMGSETGEHASWVCSVSHDISGKGFENFITHLSQDHEQEAWVERLSVLAAPSECHEKNEEAVEAGDEATILKKLSKASRQRKRKQKKKLIKKDEEAVAAGDEALRRNKWQENDCHRSVSKLMKKDEEAVAAGDEALRRNN